MCIYYVYIYLPLYISIRNRWYICVLCALVCNRDIRKRRISVWIEHRIRFLIRRAIKGLIRICSALLCPFVPCCAKPNYGVGIHIRLWLILVFAVRLAFPLRPGPRFCSEQAPGLATQLCDTLQSSEFATMCDTSPPAKACSLSRFWRDRSGGGEDEAVKNPNPKVE